MRSPWPTGGGCCAQKKSRVKNKNYEVVSYDVFFSGGNKKKIVLRSIQKVCRTWVVVMQAVRGTEERLLLSSQQLLSFP